MQRYGISANYAIYMTEIIKKNKKNNIISCPDKRTLLQKSVKLLRFIYFFAGV